MSMSRQDEHELLGKKNVRNIIVCIGVNIILLILVIALYGPLMRPWVQERIGMANLARESYNMQIQVEAARAERDAAALRAQAIAIVGEVAQAFPEYRNQELMGAFGAALEQGNIPITLYVPTSNGLPLLQGITTQNEE